MARTGTVTIDGDGTPDPIIADIPCKEIQVFSDETVNTGGYLVYQPSSTSTPVRLSDAEKAIFTANNGRMFQAGAIVGFMKSVSPGPFVLNKVCR
jgi:hypothetical protein